MGRATAIGRAIIVGLAAVALAACTNPSSQPPSPLTPPAFPITPTSPPSTPPTASATVTPTPAATGVPGSPQVLATSLPSPWGLAFLPDGRAIVTSRDEGTVRLVSPDGEVDLVRATGPDGAVPDVIHGGEGGLLGLAVPPQWRDGEDIYLYRTAANGNQVVRAALSGNRLGEPELVFGGIPAASHHNGGQLRFGPDGYLYVTTGDAGYRPNAPDKGSLGGKILRITTEGRAAPGNPWSGLPLWSLGHRNVQGIDWHANGTMYASEFGQNTYDELNAIKPGGNYGWPEVEGKGGAGRGFLDPLAVWPTSQASPSGLAVAADAVYLAALRGERLWRVPLHGSKIGKPEAFFEGEFGRLRTVVLGPDGALWLLTNNTDGRGQVRDGDDKLIRVPLDRVAAALQKQGG